MSRILVAWFALALGLGCSADDASVKLDGAAEPEQRAKVRAFYSGHSLTDGVPEAIAAFAPSLAAHGKPADFDFDFQSAVGSLIRTRSVEPLHSGGRYDVLVITERHDLPWTIEHEQTLPALAHFTETFRSASPRGEVLLYQGWLERNGGPIADWLGYERDALPLWECTASAINRALPEQSPKLRVLPGASALTALVESIVNGTAPGVAGDEAERLALIFADAVHLAPAGLYFMGLVHYAALFGVSPEGAAAPPGLSPALALHMQQLAWQHIAGYAKRAAAASTRDQAWCRAYAQDVMCPRYYQYRKPAGGSLAARAGHIKNALSCDLGSAFAE